MNWLIQKIAISPSLTYSLPQSTILFFKLIKEEDNEDEDQSDVAQIKNIELKFTKLTVQIEINKCHCIKNQRKDKDELLKVWDLLILVDAFIINWVVIIGIRLWCNYSSDHWEDHQTEHNWFGSIECNGDWLGFGSINHW